MVLRKWLVKQINKKLGFAVLLFGISLILISCGSPKRDLIERNTVKKRTMPRKSMFIDASCSERKQGWELSPPFCKTSEFHEPPENVRASGAPCGASTGSRLRQPSDRMLCAGPGRLQALS